MSEWKAKRFWSEALVLPAEGGYTVQLDARPVKTPAKSLLVVPTEALAQRIAAEWNAQGKEVDPLTMPFTRSANAALDKVTHQKSEVADLVAAYGDADLLCYRAERPETLVARQTEAWDPLLDWAADELGAPLEARVGVMHIPQDPVVLSDLAARVHAMDPFTLTGFHDLVGMSGSLILGFAALSGFKPASEIWALSRVDELWQAEQWGHDEEAMEVAAKKESDFLHAKVFADVAKTE
jgi:chaperone required for assembly of F1-ATPase